MRHIISILMANEAGALSRVAGMFSARGYNIESLNVAPTQNPVVSRLTMVTTGSDAVIDQINKQLRKLVDVVDVADLTGGAHIEREVLDDTPGSFTVELTGTGAELDDAVGRLAEHGRLVELVRSGAAAMACGTTALKIPQ